MKLRKKQIHFFTILLLFLSLIFGAITPAQAGSSLKKHYYYFEGHSPEILYSSNMANYKGATTSNKSVCPIRIGTSPYLMTVYMTVIPQKPGRATVKFSTTSGTVSTKIHVVKGSPFKYVKYGKDTILTPKSKYYTNYSAKKNNQVLTWKLQKGYKLVKAVSNGKKIRSGEKISIKSTGNYFTFTVINKKKQLMVFTFDISAPKKRKKK